MTIKTLCPDCDSLREVTPTPEPVGHTGTARRWQLEYHSDGKGNVCPGSGKRV